MLHLDAILLHTGTDRIHHWEMDDCGRGQQKETWGYWWKQAQHEPELCSAANRANCMKALIEGINHCITKLTKRGGFSYYIWHSCSIKICMQF